MKKLLSLLLSLLIALPLPPAVAQQSAAPLRSQAELDRMLAPIALYPDALLSQVLMAATYPLEVVEAARWSRAHRGLRGDEAVRTAADEDWDPSVKSLLAFPDLLSRMDEELAWTKSLGDAFLAEETRVMETVQQLRRRAQASGGLGEDERLRFVDEGGAIAVVPADPRVVYVPYYDPLVVYGPWWWPAYPPVAWAPWPGYAVARSGFWWGIGVGVTTGFFFGTVSWRHRHVTVVRNDVHYQRRPAVRRTVVVRRPVVVGHWRHDPSHRRGDDYRRETRRAPMMPPAWRSSAPVRAAPRETARERTAPARAVPYDRRHGSSGRPVDRADGGRRAGANAAQHRAARPHGYARDAGRHAGPVPVRPAVRAGVAGGRPRMER